MRKGGLRRNTTTGGVPDESDVIAGVVLRPDAGFVQQLGANAGRHREEFPYGRSVGRRKCDMGFAEPLAAGLPTDPEFWLSRGAEADGLAKVHHTASAERGEHSVVES